MAISIVSTPITDNTVTPVASTIENGIFHENVVPNMYVQADTLQLQPTQLMRGKDANPKQQDPFLAGVTSIVKMDIQAPVEIKEPTVPVPSPAIVGTPSKGFSMDDILETKNVVASPKPVEMPGKLQDVSGNASKTPIGETSSYHKTMKRMAVALGGGVGILVLRFVIKTMFPLGLGTTDTTITNTPVPVTPLVADVSTGTSTDTGMIITTGDTIALEEHAVATIESPLTTISTQLQYYRTQGLTYHDKGLIYKERDMIRYGLFISKKSDELLAALDLRPDMDTSDIEVYFAQFDDYIQTMIQQEDTYLLSSQSLSNETTGSTADSTITQQLQ